MTNRIPKPASRNQPTAPARKAWDVVLAITLGGVLCLAAWWWLRPSPNPASGTQQAQHQAARPSPAPAAMTALPALPSASANLVDAGRDSGSTSPSGVPGTNTISQTTSAPPPGAPPRPPLDTAEVARQQAQNAAVAAVLQSVQTSTATVSAERPKPVPLQRNKRHAKDDDSTQTVPVQVSETGLQAYPHAELVQNQSSRQRTDRGNDVTATLLTRDTLAAVRAFYAPMLDSPTPADTPALRQVTVLNDAADRLDVRIVDLQARAVQRVRAVSTGNQVVIQLSRASAQ